MTRFFRHALGLGFLALALDAGAQNPNYKDLHNLLIQFYGYQRAGDKTIDNKNPFYKASPFPHSTDALNGKDLSSGWYDAGDFVKFGLPFSFSVYCLLKGYDVFPNGYDDITSWDYKGAPDGIPDILGEVKIATDYMQRAVISASQIVVDVGNASSDHGALGETGYANSSRTSPRTVYATGGADVAGLYAASLALMANLYKKHDAAYAAACLAKAKEAFQFGVANAKLSSQQNNGEFYKTTTYKDKMACGAVELYRATGEETYLTQAKSYQAGVVSHYYVLGYANTGDISAFELKRLKQPNAEGVWLTDVAYTVNRVVKAANASPLIKGAFINSDWGNAGNAACAGFSAALAFMVTGESVYLDFARSQAHWVAGLSPFSQSYIVGFGTNAPTAPHHRNDYTKLNNVRLKGGVVSGPSPSSGFDPAKPENSQWSFTGSDPNNYKNTEVALNYNAGMVGLVAFLRDYDNPPANLVRIATPLAAAPGNVDLNVAPVVITGALAKAGAWSIVLSGNLSKAKRTVTGTTAAISVSWGGEVDSGNFVAGEVVNVALKVDNLAAYHENRASTSFNLTGLKKEAFKATDIKIDDFEDGDSLTKQSAPWRTFTDKPAGTSSTSPATAGAAILANEGESATRGMNIRLIGNAGATRPFAGVKCGFNASATAVGLGPALSVIFDIKSTAGSSLWVELEQSSVADGAYHGRKIDFANDGWSRMRIPFSAFTQPDWKTASVPLNLGSITALRFTSYGANSVRFSLDNVHIEGLSIQSAATRISASGPESMLSQLSAGRDGLSYSFHPPALLPGPWSAEVLDVFGRSLATRPLGRLDQAKAVSFPGLGLSPGWYFLRHSAEGSPREYVHRIQLGAGNR